MRCFTFAPVALTLGAAIASAQGPVIMRAGPAAPFMLAAQPHAVIGVTTTSGTTTHDTLGVMISTIVPDSPAEKAGLEEGDRIAAVNGVSLRLAAADVGDPEMGGIMSRRLTRELDKVKPGDDIALSVYVNDHLETKKIKAVAPSDLYALRGGRAVDVARVSERPTLGLELAETGSPRDTLGVFVMRVDEHGPAEKAGIVEGSRIASINGVNVRGEHPADDDDVVMMRASNVSRFERTLDALHPGDKVQLRVFYDGQYRTVTLDAGRASDMPMRRRSMTIVGAAGPDFATAFTDIDAAQIETRVRRALDTAGLVAGRALANAGTTLRLFGGENSVRW